MHDWPEYETQFNQIIEDFEQLNPDIEIETTVITWDVLTKTLQTAFASGDAPDVTCCWLDRMGGFNSLGAAYDLTEAMEADGASWKIRIYSCFLRSWYDWREDLRCTIPVNLYCFSIQ